MDCAICRREMVEHVQPPFEPDAAVEMAECGHQFHHGCITKWLEGRDSCPLCGRGGEFRPTRLQPPSAQYDNAYYFAKAVNAHIYKLAAALAAPVVLPASDLIEHVASRIFARERWYFHPGGSAFVMRRNDLDINDVIGYMRGGEVKFTRDHSNVTIYPLDFYSDDAAAAAAAIAATTHVSWL